MAEAFTYSPQNTAHDNQWCYVLDYMRQLWDAAVGLAAGRNFLYQQDTDNATEETLGNVEFGDELQAGMPIGSHIFRTLQTVIVNNYQYFLNTTISPTDYNDPADWNWTFETFKYAMNRPDAVTADQLFRRAVDKAPYDPNFVDYSYGYAEPGDYVGRHLFEDLARALHLLTRLRLQGSISNGYTRYGQYYNGSSWQDTVDNAVTNWNNMTPAAGVPGDIYKYTLAQYMGPNFVYYVGFYATWATILFTDGAHGFPKAIHNSILSMPCEANCSIYVKGAPPIDPALGGVFDNMGDNVADDTWTCWTTLDLNTLASNSSDQGGGVWNYTTPSTLFGTPTIPASPNQPAAGVTEQKGYKITDIQMVLDVKMPGSIYQ